MKPITELKDLLAQEISSAQILCDILKAEREALAENKLDALNDMSDQKQIQAETLAQLAHKRNDWLAAQGFSAGTTGLNEFISRFGSEVDSTWKN